MFICDGIRGFRGIIDGNNKTLKFNNVKDRYGNIPTSFIDGMVGGTIKDLTIEGNFSTAVFATYCYDD